MSERRGYRVEDRRRVIPLEYRVNRDTSINPNTWRHKRENTPSMINDRPETKAWNVVKNILPTGGNVGRHVGDYLSDIFGIGSLVNKASFYSGGSPGPKERQKLQPKERSNQEPLKGYYGWENVIPRDLRYDSQLPHQYQYIDRPISGPGQTIVSDEAPPWQYKNTRTSDWYDQHSSPLTPKWQWPEGIMSMADNRTSRNPNTWHQSPYFGMGGYDFVEDHDPTPENLAFFQEIKDRDAMERDAGWYPYFNPSLIENDPSFGLDYMSDLWGGKGKVGFRKGLNDDDYNAYANWEIGF